MTWYINFLAWMQRIISLVCFANNAIHTWPPGGGTRSENWWGCAAGRWKLDPKRSREKWNLGPKRSNSLRIGSFNTPKDRFGVGGWKKIPQKDRARSCQSEKRGSKPRHICITHHIGSTPPPGRGLRWCRYSTEKCLPDSHPSSVYVVILSISPIWRIAETNPLTKTSKILFSIVMPTFGKSCRRPWLHGLKNQS